jgi:SSS family solute:Na+ symporter
LDLGDLNFTHHKYMLGVYSHVILFVVGYLASLLFKPTDSVEGLTYREWKNEKKQKK